MADPDLTKRPQLGWGMEMTELEQMYRDGRAAGRLEAILQAYDLVKILVAEIDEHEHIYGGEIGADRKILGYLLTNSFFDPAREDGQVEIADASTDTPTTCAIHGVAVETYENGHGGYTVLCPRCQKALGVCIR